MKLFILFLIVLFGISQIQGYDISNPNILSNARVVPGSYLTVTVRVTINNGPVGNTLKAQFVGETDYWKNANLPFVSQTGQVYTFSHMILAPTQIGVYHNSWNVKVIQSGQILTTLTARVEVTCSDNIFCNGEERYINNRCVPGLLPCNDGFDCTRDVCNELAKNCTYFPDPTQPISCPVCTPQPCKPDCRKRLCGEDGCGGSCGSCTVAGESCVSGACQNVNIFGSCANPHPLFETSTLVPAAGLITQLLADTSIGIDMVIVPCGLAGIKEYIYSFTIGPDNPTGMGFDIRLYGVNGPDTLDVALAIFQGNCVPMDSYSMCADDSTPPGGLGSRVFGKLLPGDYLIVATGYSSTQLGPVILDIKFVPNCVPQCDSKFCGSDGCGGTCGSCLTTQICSPESKCITSPCTPTCNGRMCGGDGCGGSCGGCKEGWFCFETNGKCKKKSGCDGMRPVCNGNGGSKYCGADCLWHTVDEHLIDLVPAPYESILPSIGFQHRSFVGGSCAIEEFCVPSQGKFMLMTFDTNIINIDAIASFRPDPMSEYFSYHTCHQHFHFDGFAEFALASWDEKTIIIQGSKKSYCMEDAGRAINSPAIGCDPVSSCENQGISAGYMDVYSGNLDCQWLVVNGSSTTNYQTGVALDTWYKLRICTNVNRNFAELTYDNNCIFYPVYIPYLSDDGSQIRMVDLVLPPKPV